MKEEHFSALSKLLLAEFEEKKLRAKPILDTEKRLRSELRRLDELETASRSSDDTLLLMRPFGGDVAWQIWISQKRRTLTGELAIAMAAKLEKTREMRRSYGRMLALKAIQKKARAQRVQAVAKRRENQMLSGMWR